MLKKTILLVLILFFLTGCIQLQQEKKIKLTKETANGEKLIIIPSVVNINDSKGGIQKNVNEYTINLNESPKQKIKILLGNRLEREVLVNSTNFTCKGTNTEKGEKVGVELLDYYFECVNCDYKEACSLQTSKSEETATDCLLNKGKKLVRIMPGAGLEFTALLKPVKNLNATMECNFTIDIFEEIYNEKFTIKYIS